MQRDRAYLLKVIEDIKDIEIFIKNISYSEFLADTMLKKAVCMSLINIGESVKGLSDDIKLKNKDIPWKKAIALRDIVAHKYGTIDFEIIWQTINEDIHSLKEAIKQILNT